MTSSVIRPVLCLGFGNPSRGDDGAGPAVIDALSRYELPSRLELLAAHQLLPEFSERFADSDWVVLLDADARQPAGVITRIRVRPAETCVGGHRWTAAAIAFLAMELHGRCGSVIAYTIGGADFSATAPWKFTLTPRVAEAVDRLAARLIKRAAIVDNVTGYHSNRRPRGRLATADGSSALSSAFQSGG